MIYLEHSEDVSSGGGNALLKMTSFVNNVKWEGVVLYRGANMLFR